MINVEWKKNLSDGSWDGNFVNESTVKPIEYNKEGESSGVIDDGKLSSNYQHQLTGSISKGDTIDKKEILTFVNVDGAMSNMSNIVDGRADQIASMVLRGSDLQKADAYHYLETMDRTGINYAEEFKNGRITEEKLQEDLAGFINEDMKTHFKLEEVFHHGNPKWLGLQHVDIWFPKYKIGIEYQGKQHDEPVEFFGGEESFLKNHPTVDILVCGEGEITFKEICDREVHNLDQIKGIIYRNTDGKIMDINQPQLLHPQSHHFNETIAYSSNCWV